MRVEKEYLQERMKKLEFEMGEIMHKNVTLAKQNHKLTVELPQRMMADLALLHEQSNEVYTHIYVYVYVMKARSTVHCTVVQRSATRYSTMRHTATE